MFGSGIRREDVAPKISSTNVFAALETLKKKKKSLDKDRKGSSKSKLSTKTQEEEPEPSEVVWFPIPLNKSWADVDDDDDDYYKSAPVLPGWGSEGQKHNKGSEAPVEEESGSEDDGLDDVDEDVEDEAEQELDSPLPAELIVKKPPHPAPLAPKDPERQLSKKAQKKKELEELDALLAEFAVSNKDDKVAIQPQNATAEKNAYEQAKDSENENAAALAESKTSKKKKGKNEKSKESKITHEPAIDPNASDDVAVTEAMEEAAAAAGIDMKEKLKKVSSTKKKKSGKDVDAASKIAASEAAARTAKLAAAKKREEPLQPTAGAVVSLLPFFLSEAEKKHEAYTVFSFCCTFRLPAKQTQHFKPYLVKLSSLLPAFSSQTWLFITFNNHVTVKCIFIACIFVLKCSIPTPIGKLGAH